MRTTRKSQHSLFSYTSRSRASQLSLHRHSLCLFLNLFQRYNNTYWLGLDDASVTYRVKSTASWRRPLNSARVRGGDERETSALTTFFGGFCQRTTLFSASLPTKSNRAIFLRPRSIASQQDLTRGERCKIFASSKMDMAFRDAQATKLDGWTNRWSRSQKSIDDVP